MALDPHQITEHEHGLIRLFTSAMEPEVDAAITPQNVHRLLGDDITLGEGRLDREAVRRHRADEALEVLGIRGIGDF